MSLLNGLACILIVVQFASANKLFLILLDGFRWDYFDHPQLQLKGFPRIIQQGVKAKYMIPDFPTNSFPNYRTIETGLHVETHGFVGNFMYDVQTDLKFHLTDSDQNDASWYDNAEAFYITGEKQGKRSALYYWRGCQVPQSGWRASFCVPHRKIPTAKDIDWALKDGLSRLQQGISDIIYLYHEEIDNSGHFYGPSSGQVLRAIQEVDRQLNTFLDDVAKSGLAHDLDIIIVSDHGMTDLDVQQILNLTSVINMDDIHEIVEEGSQSQIWPVKGKEKEVYESLKDFSPHLKVFYKEELQDRWFIKKHTLIPPIYLYAEPGWYMVHPKSKSMHYEKIGNRYRGNHGFDNNKEDMRSIFLAFGPSFKKGYIAKPFSNVNVYQLVCHVAGIKPQRHNGTWSDVQEMLQWTQNRDISPQSHVEL